MIDILTNIVLAAEFHKDENCPHNRYILSIGSGFLCEVWLTARSWTFNVYDEEGNRHTQANFWSLFDEPDCVDTLKKVIAEYC